MADVDEVVIRMKGKELVFKNPSVTAVTVQGQKTYQIVGESQERERKGEERGEEGGVSDEDVKLVMAQTGCTAEEAKAALKETDGAPAEAILKIMSSRA